jgi:hypothetical protein
MSVVMCMYGTCNKYSELSVSADAAHEGTREALTDFAKQC